MACCQSVAVPLSMASCCRLASSRTLSRCRLAFILAMVASSRISMAPRRSASCSSSGPKALPGSLKSEILNSYSTRKSWRISFCCRRLPAFFSRSNRLISSISFCANLFLPICVHYKKVEGAWMMCDRKAASSLQRYGKAGTNDLERPFF